MDMESDMVRVELKTDNERRKKELQSYEFDSHIDLSFSFFDDTDTVDLTVYREGVPDEEDKYVNVSLSTDELKAFQDAIYETRVNLEKRKAQRAVQARPQAYSSAF